MNGPRLQCLTYVIWGRLERHRLNPNRPDLSSQSGRVCRRWVGPGHPPARIPRHLLGVLQQLDQVFERLDSVELRRVDQTHECVPGPGPRSGPVEQRVLAVHDGPLQGGLAGVVIQWGAGFT